jgi:hypothetical protein
VANRHVADDTQQPEETMRGVITGRDVVANLALIWREFGAGCVVRCLVAFVSRRPTTFLDVVTGRTEGQR